MVHERNTHGQGANSLSPEQGSARQGAGSAKRGRIMISSRAARLLLIGAVGLTLAACGRGPGSGIGSGDSRLFGGNRASSESQTQGQPQAARSERLQRSTIWDLFDNRDNPNTTVEVNKYIWNAALDVLNFLPIQSVDPFTGVIVTGYGTPPGGGRAYRATIYVQDPALDARSLKVALESRGGGTVSPETVRAVEDAILTRARQLRIADSRL
jgi:hypothetical protein